MTRRLALPALLFLTFSPLLSAAPPLEVVQRAPVGDLDSIEAAKEVVVTFNRPMVALTSGEDGGSFCPCRITPSLPGRCRWRGTNTLVYEFDAVPGPGHSFQVLIPAGTASRVGKDSLKKDVSFAFNTQRPEVESVYPGDGSKWLGLQPAFFARFNLSVTASVAPDYVELAGPDGRSLPLTLVEHTAAELRRAHEKGQYTDVEAYRWGGSNQVLEFRPRQALAPATHYTLRLKQGWPAQGGQAGDNGLKEDKVCGYDTYGAFEVRGVEDYSECSSRARLIVSNPVLEEHLEQYVKVSPAVAVDPWSEEGPRYEGYEEKGAWRLPFEGWRFRAETRYHFSVQAGLKDVFGNSLAKGAEFDWTAPAVCPDLDARGGFGVMESYVPPKHPVDATNQASLGLRYKSLKTDEAVGAYKAYDSEYAVDKSFDGYKEADWPVPATPNVKTHSYVDLYQLLGADLGSFTLLGIPKKEDGNKRWINALDNRTDLGLSLKSSPESVLIWTTDLRLGTPRAGIPVEIRDGDNRVLWKGSSDADGLAMAPGWRGLGLKKWTRWEAPQLFVLAYSPNGTALLDSHFHGGIDPWRFRLPYGGYEVAQPEAPRRFEVFADRGVYRPGESVHFKGWVRDLAHADWALPKGLDHLDLQVLDSRDKLALTLTARLGAEGGFDLAFGVPQGAATGTWTLRTPPAKGAAASDGEDEDGGAEGGFSQGFRVEAVKAASYEVGLNGLKAWQSLGDPLKASVEGHYLAGAGMPGADGDWSLSVSPADFSPEGWDGWNFSLPRGEDFSGWDDEDEGADQDQDNGGRRARLAGSGSFKLDAASRAALSVATQGLEQCSPCQALLEVNLSSPDRQKIFVRRTVMLHQGLAYPGFRPGREFAELGKPFAAQVVVLDPDGRTLPGRQLSLRLMREFKQNVRAVGAFGRLEWRSEDRVEEAGQWKMESGAAPLDWSFTPAQPGRYRLLLKAVDTQGHAQEAGAYIYAYGPGEASWTRDDSEMVELVADKAEYQVGDTAHIIVKSPYDKATALVTVEREGVQQAKVRSLGSADALDIPITAAMLPNIYVGVELVRGRAVKRAYGPDGEDLAKPQARFGYAALKVLPLSRKLAVAASLDKPDYRPGGAVKAGVTVADAGGKPVKAEVALYAVDEGVLQLTGYQTPDPFGFFYGPRPLWASTSDNRLLVIGMRNFGEKGQDRGGGGGGLAPLPGMEGVDLRRHFESLAFWSAELHTGADGKLEADFTLPDNLTRFRLIAVAASGNRFGSTDTGLKVSKALMLRPSLPRFARLGDAMQAGVTVQNATAKAGQVTVEAVSDGALGLGGEPRQTVTLGPGEARELRWPLTALQLGPARLGFKASGRLGADESDGLEWKLPVEQPEKAEHSATSGVVDAEAAHEALARPSQALSGTTRVDLAIASTAMLGLRGGVGYLLDYPHLCLEQRLSKILPAVVGPDLLEAFHLAAPKEQLAAAQAVLDALPQFQSGSGGYRYWTDSDKADPWLTAYALEVAALARDSGFKLPKDSIDRAVDWLRNHYDSPGDWAYPYSDQEKDVLRAWALYALSRHGVKLPGLYSQLYGRRAQLPLYSKADLLRCAAVLGTPEQAQDLAQALLNQANVDARVLHFEESHADRMPWVHASTVSVTGFCVDALLMAQHGFAGDEKAARWLVEARGKDGAWTDTQSNAWALMALTRYFRVHEKEVPDFKAGVSLGGKEIWSADFKGRSLAAQTRQILEGQLFGAGPEAGLDFTKSGAGRLYYSLLLAWTPAKVDKPAFEGFEIERAISGLDGKPAGATLRAGQRYRVTLKVRSRQDRTFVALTDFLPAGCEVVDSSLATESQAAAPAGGSEASADNPWGAWWGRFQRHENYDDRVQVYADFLSAGEHAWTYTVQATTPGTFSQPAAWVEMMYEPETFGRTAGGTVVVEAGQP